ncbi:unnamed protein product [Staurois parvus]|uniref:RNA-binding protein 42 n=1 Tax=Staurois parvus TaxID=386267 RepID=A0ABN9F2D0_9NEOB|nr:unnamed protein product [Staurois parvus]
MAPLPMIPRRSPPLWRSAQSRPPPAPVGPLPPPARPVVQSSPKINPTVIQAAPTVYTVPPVRKVEEEKVPEVPIIPDDKDMSYEESVIGPSMPEIEPMQPEVVLEPVQEDKKKSKPEKMKRCIRTAAGTSWEDQSLLEWDTDDFRIFCGDLGNEVNDDILARAFSRYPSFLKAKVIRDKRTGKTKGYGFVSFKDPNDYVRAMREMNGKYVGSRPIKLRKSMWKDRNIDVVRKKQKEKKKLGLR